MGKSKYSPHLMEKGPIFLSPDWFGSSNYAFHMNKQTCVNPSNIMKTVSKCYLHDHLTKKNLLLLVEDSLCIHHATNNTIQRLEWSTLKGDPVPGI